MPLSEEKLDRLLLTLERTINELVTSNVRRDEMHGQLMHLLEENRHLKAEPQSPDSIMHEGDVIATPKPRKHAKGNRPTINVGMDDMQWVIFEDAWGRYKRVEELDKNENMCLELRDACSPEVNQLLYDFIGPDKLNDESLTETILLAHIKSVSVKSVHVEVHRWSFANMRQEEGECVTKFVGRLSRVT
jgi:hypothetical protein